MNERIRELARQAGYKPLSPPTFADELNEIFMQKFAELIVRECADLCDNLILKGTEHDLTYNDGVMDCAIILKQHFGVKE